MSTQNIAAQRKTVEDKLHITPNGKEVTVFEDEELLFITQMEKYHALVKERNNKKAAAAQPSSTQSLEAYPELIQFIQETEKNQDVVNKQCLKDGVDHLERTLFAAISALNCERVIDLIALNININICIPMPDENSLTQNQSPLYLSPLSHIFFSLTLTKQRLSSLTLLKVRHIISILIEAGALDSNPSNVSYKHLLNNTQILFIKFLVDFCLDQDKLLPLLNSVLKKTQHLNLEKIDSPSQPFGQLLLELEKQIKNSNEPLPVGYLERVRCIIESFVNTCTFHYENPIEDNRKILNVIIELYNFVTRNQTDKDNLIEKTLNIILEDISIKSLQYFSKIPNYSYLDMASTLLDYNMTELSTTQPTLFAYDSFDNENSNESQFQLRANFIFLRILQPAEILVKAAYVYGFSLARHEKLFLIPALWKLVKEYLSHLTFIDDAYQLGLHIDLPDETSSEFLFRTLPSIQIFPNPINDVIAYIESMSPSSKNNKEKEDTEASTVKQSGGQVRTQLSKEEEDKIKAAFIKRYGQQITTVITSHFTSNSKQFFYAYSAANNLSLKNFQHTKVSQSKQLNQTVISHFSGINIPNPKRFFYLFQETETAKPCIGLGERGNPASFPSGYLDKEPKNGKTAKTISILKQN